MLRNMCVISHRTLRSPAATPTHAWLRWTPALRRSDGATAGDQLTH